MPDLGVGLPSLSSNFSTRLLFLTFPLYFGSGAPGVTAHAGPVSGVSIGASRLAISFAGDSRALDSVATCASSLAGVLLLSLPVPLDVRESFSSYGVLLRAFDIPPSSEFSSFEEAFICFLVFLPIVAGGASTSDVSPFFVVFLVFLRIEEATGASAPTEGLLALPWEA